MSHIRKNRFSRLSRVSLAVSALLLAQTALAQDFIRGGEDRFTLNLGGIVNQFGTIISLNGGTTQGTPIDLESNGLSKTLSSALLSGTWRITERNRLDFLYFSGKRDGSRQYSRDLNVGGNVIPAGFTVSAESKSDFFLADYRYSLYKTEALELGGTLGVYGGTFRFNVTGTGVSGTNYVTYSTSSSTTVPLPLVGVTADWYIQPRWKLSSSLMGMSAKIGSVDGSMTVFQLGTDYMLTRNWGLGMSYMYSNLNADVTKSSFNGNIDWQNNSVMLYGTFKY